MENETKEIVASSLTKAFYSAAERRPAYLGPERRREESLNEGQRDLRQAGVTPREVYETYKRMLRLLDLD